MSTHFDGIAFRLCLHFARNPGAALFSGEICEKWNVPQKMLFARLAPARRKGWIVSHKMAGEKQVFFSAGPALEAVMQGTA